MKRIALLLLAAAPLLLPATPTLGQTTIALTGGANRASLGVTDHDLVFTTRWVTRPALGLEATIPLWNRLGLQLGGSYSGKGASFRNRAFLNHRGSLEIDYIEVRALGKALVMDSEGGTKLYLLGGAAAATEASCQEYSEVVISDEARGHRRPCPPASTSSWDFGVVGGMSVEMWVSDRFGLLLNGLYTRGFRDIDDASDNITLNTRTLSLHTGIIYSIN